MHSAASLGDAYDILQVILARQRTVSYPDLAYGADWIQLGLIHLRREGNS